MFCLARILLCASLHLRSGPEGGCWSRLTSAGATTASKHPKSTRRVTKPAQFFAVDTSAVIKPQSMTLMPRYFANFSLCIR